MNIVVIRTEKENFQHFSVCTKNRTFESNCLEVQMKSTVSALALLAFISTILLSSCSKDEVPPQPLPDENIRFMVISDLHYMHPDILKNEGKAFDEYNAEECKLLRESGALLDEMMQRVKSEKPSFLIVSGDMTKDGEVICHEHVAEVFKTLAEETGTKVLVIPGNHDINNPHSLYYDGDRTSPAPSATEEMFARIYAGCGYAEAVERREGSLDYMAYPVDNIAFIGVDSNEKNTDTELRVQGGLSKEQVVWIREMVRKAHLENRYVILSMHHNLVDFYDNAQMIRGANIANARNDTYNNSRLIDDLCAAGVDVVFSGHSHMHSITRAWRGSDPIYSIVTSSLVNLPLAYRTCTVDKNGLMTVVSGDLKNCRIPGCADLLSEGDKYWRNLSAYYMKTAADKAWDAAGIILQCILDFKDKDDLQSFLTQRFEKVFYTFLTRTSDGNEHLFSPQENYDAAEAALEGLFDFFDEKKVTIPIEIAIRLIFDADLDEVHQAFSDFFKSAYYNYLGEDCVLPDDAVEIQLHR